IGFSETNNFVVTVVVTSIIYNYIVVIFGLVKISVNSIFLVDISSFVRQDVLVIRKALFNHNSFLKDAFFRIIIHFVFVGQGIVIKHSSNIDIIFSEIVWSTQGEKHPSVIGFYPRFFATKIIY